MIFAICFFVGEVVAVCPSLLLENELDHDCKI